MGQCLETKIPYTVRNDGCGAADVIFMESQEQVDLDQQFAELGWGDGVGGYVRISHDGPIKCLDVLTIEEQIKELREELEYDNKDRDVFNHIQELEKLRG